MSNRSNNPVDGMPIRLLVPDANYMNRISSQTFNRLEKALSNAFWMLKESPLVGDWPSS